MLFTCHAGGCPCRCQLIQGLKCIVISITPVGGSLEMTDKNHIHNYLIFSCSIFVHELANIYRNDNFIYNIKNNMLLLILAG